MYSVPKYDTGSVVDIRFTHDAMPDRIYIETVYHKDNSNGWIYRVFSEKSGKFIFMRENEIIPSNRTAKVYENPIIQSLYNDGYRFCGNSKRETAINRASKLKSANYIANVILIDAFDTEGNTLNDQYGLWVRYNYQIGNSSIHNRIIVK